MNYLHTEPFSKTAYVIYKRKLYLKVIDHLISCFYFLYLTIFNLYYRIQRCLVPQNDQIFPNL